MFVTNLFLGSYYPRALLGMVVSGNTGHFHAAVILDFRLSIFGLSGTHLYFPQACALPVRAGGERGEAVLDG